MKTDEKFMAMALTLAERGWGRTNPNPLVGAVIVKDGQVIAEGCHALLGEEHAERAALRCAKEAGVSVQGASLYVNLEPCSHVGRTPPCTAAIIEQGIREVVVAMVDPNPLVSGKGIRQLQEAGIQVRVGVLEKEAVRLNEIFIKYITAHVPFVIMKAAMTLDGKIATEKGDSHWISGEFSRQKVHHLRNRVAAIMVGIKTVLADNPSLTTRLATGNGRDPLRIVVDSQGQIPLDSKVVQVQSSAGLILATTRQSIRTRSGSCRKAAFLSGSWTGRTAMLI